MFPYYICLLFVRLELCSRTKHEGYFIKDVCKVKKKVLWSSASCLSVRQSYWSKPVLNKICRVILFQPHLFPTKHTYLRIYTEFSMVGIKMFKFLAGFFANSHFLFPITNQTN